MESEQMHLSLGDKIRLLRKEAGMTQAELAERMHVNIQTIRSYESDKYRPKLGGFMELGRIFNIGHDYFYEGVQVTPAQQRASDREVNAFNGMLNFLRQCYDQFEDVELEHPAGGYVYYFRVRDGDKTYIIDDDDVKNAMSVAETVMKTVLYSIGDRRPESEVVNDMLRISELQRPENEGKVETKKHEIP